MNTPSAKRVAHEVFGPELAARALACLRPLEPNLGAASTAFLCTGLLRMARGDLTELKRLVQLASEDPEAIQELRRWYETEARYRDDARHGRGDLDWFADVVADVARHAPRTISHIRQHNRLRLNNEGAMALILRPHPLERLVWIHGPEFEDHAFDKESAVEPEAVLEVVLDWLGNPIQPKGRS